MGLKLLLIVAGGAVLVAAMACAGGGADPGVVAIAVNRDAQAPPRLAFYAGVPGRDRFLLPPGNYELIAMDMAGGLATRSRTLVAEEDVAAGVLLTLNFPAPTERAGRLNREAMRNLFLFFARFSKAQTGLEDLLTEQRTRPAPASPDDLTVTQILGEEQPQGRLLGIRDWETEMASWGRTLELGLRAIEPELPAALLDGRGSPFAEAAALVRQWRDGPAVDRRAFLEVVGRTSAERRAELYQAIASVFAVASSKSPEDFYERVAAGELDPDMWPIANFAYGAGSYADIARAQGLEPGRPYYDRWLRQSPSAWGFVWSVSLDTAERARLPAEVFETARQGAAASAASLDGSRQVGSP